jgi:predicted AAA+ superfamily ATPase
MLKRDLTSLYNWNTQFPRRPLVLRGARQVGKSTIVRIFAQEAGLRLVEINLEKHPLLDATFATLDVVKITAALESICRQYLDDKTCLLFLDEIQATPNAIAALRYFYEDRPNLRVIAAGSLLEFALAKHSFSMPVGRVEYFWVRPLSFTDFLIAKGEDFLADKCRHFKLGEEWPESLHQQIWEQYRWYLVIGGMPAVVDAFVKGAKEKRLQNILDSIVASYANDFSKYGKTSELARLQTIYRKLPRCLGQKIKYSSVMPDTKTDLVKRSINLLAMAGVIQKVLYSNCSGIPIRSNCDDRIYKLYWLDIGLLNRMQGVSWSTVLSDSMLSNEGLLAEQFVAQEFVAANDSMDPAPLSYWIREGKTANAEVDFVVQNNLEIVPIEVKSGSPGTFKSMAQLIQKTGTKRAVRFANVLPLTQSITIKVPEETGSLKVQFDLINLPIYLAGKISSGLLSQDQHLL